MELKAFTNNKLGQHMWDFGASQEAVRPNNPGGTIAFPVQEANHAVRECFLHDQWSGRTGDG